MGKVKLITYGEYYFDFSKQGQVYAANDDFLEISGYTKEDLENGAINFYNLVPEESKEEYLDMIGKEYTGEKPIFIRHPFRLKDGSSIYVLCLGNPVDKDRVQVMITDYSEHMNLRQQYSYSLTELEMQAEKFRLFAVNSDDIFFDYFASEDNLYVTAPNRLDGEPEVIKQATAKHTVREYVHEDDVDEFQRLVDGLKEKASYVKTEFRCNYFEEDYCWYRVVFISVSGDTGSVERIFGKMSSIQDEKKLKRKIHRDNEYINYLLETDSVTGLLNRKSFLKKAQKIISSLDDEKVYAFVYSDIDDFSYVNDNFGFEEGNAMLADFGRIISKTAATVISSRLYSDYFVGLYCADSREEIIKSVEVRNESFAELQKNKYPAVSLQISCGVYFITDKSIDINIAVDNANLARRSVKTNKDIQIGLYARRMRTQKTHEQAIANEIHSAIANRQIEMFIQPKFSLSTRELIGAEALARWRNEDGTYKMPYEFIHVLEKVGYIEDLDFFIYEEVLKTLENWKRLGKKVIPISVNFSRYHVNKPDFADKIIALANNYDVDKSDVEIEITESCFAEDIALFGYMQKLRDDGFKVDMDDFGIGYSTLSVLLKAPVDIVKIDKSFIDNLETSKIDRDYLKNMCALIDLTDKDIIFEGVESEGQARILVDIGYTKAQGWLYDKAQPLKAFNRKYMDILD